MSKVYKVVYEVERIIIDKKIFKNGRTMYHIKWKDWDESTNTWEPEAHLKNASKLLAEFNATWKGKEDTKACNGGVLKPADKKIKKTASLREDSKPNKKVTPEFTIPAECGFDKGFTPEKIVGATDSEGTIKFLVEWQDEDAADVELITNERARKHCPQLVMKFYEQNIQWDDK